MLLFTITYPLCCLFFVKSTLAASIPILPRAANAYAPIAATCPSTALVRPASGLSASESTFKTKRKAVADTALKNWLLQTNPGFGTGTLPTIALASSGGGYRAHLLAAGLVQGFDSRDSSVSTSGLFQTLIYHSALSGGSWFLSSFAGNNYPTVTSLKTSLWESAFEEGVLLPDGLLALVDYAELTVDIAAKVAAGFDASIVDPWGRLLSYQLLQGSDGGVYKTMSSIASLSNFTNYAVPMPIITSRGVKTFNGECYPGPNATQWEITPFEFGSWDSDVSAFTQTAYLGSDLSNGVPVVTGQCIQNYDNLGYVLGTSSDVFNAICGDIPTITPGAVGISSALNAVLTALKDVTDQGVYAIFKNPFYKYTSSSGVVNSANLISAQSELSLVDGGENFQNNPIVPFLQPARGVDVLLVGDNSDDTSSLFPNGSALVTTYVQSLNQGLTRMPFIPPVETFISDGLTTRATFFGCNATDKLTIVWLPNVNYTFASNVPTSKLVYSKAETDGMIANGVQIATQGGDGNWATCLGCAIMQKTGGALPSACAACLKKYCYYE